MSSTNSERAETLIAEALAVAYEGRQSPRGISDFLRKQDKPGKICSIFHYGRSGSFFAGSFFDDHPQVLTAHPEAIMGGSFDRLVTVDFLAGFNRCLDVTISEIEEWCDALLIYMPLFFREVRGQPQYDYYQVAKPIFRKLLLGQLLLADRGSLSHEKLLKYVMIAYRLAKGGPMEVDKPMAFIWQAHAPSEERHRWIKASFADHVMLTIVRYPEKALDSELVHAILIERARPLSTALRRSLFERMAVYSELLHCEPGVHFVIRFEDLHNSSAGVLQAICILLNVQFYEQLCDTKFAMSVTDRIVTGRRTLVNTEFECRILNYYDRIKIRFLLQEEYRLWGYDDYCEDGLDSSLKTFREDEIVRSLPFGAQSVLSEYERDGYSRFDCEMSIPKRDFSEEAQINCEIGITKELFRIERERRECGVTLIPPLFLPRSRSRFIV